MGTYATATPPDPTSITKDPGCPDTQADRAGGSLGMLAALLRRLIDKLLPPWFYPPYNFQAFDYQGYVATPAIGNTSTILSYLVPTGYNHVGRRISINYTGGGFVQGSGSLIFSVYVDDAPYKNYARILTEFGSPQIPRPTDGILANSGQTVKITVKNVSLIGGGTNCVASVGGWHYPVPRRRTGGQQ